MIEVKRGGGGGGGGKGGGGKRLGVGVIGRRGKVNQR